MEMDAGPSADDVTAVVVRQDPDASADDAANATADGAAIGDGSAEADACDPEGDPRAEQQAGCAFDPSLAVYVAGAPLGAAADGGIADGSMAHPFSTITGALANLNGKTRVYVCDGVYAEQVAMTGAAQASLYGGFDCSSGWKWDGGKTQVAPAVAGPALSVEALANASPLAIEDLTFTAIAATGQDSAGNGNSSVAAIVSKSNVAFVDVALVAGQATDGRHGANAGGTGASNYSVAPAAGGKDGAATAQSCAYVDSAFPPNDSSAGGAGGTATSPVGGTGSSNPPVPAANMESGHDGSPGAAGADGPARPAAVAALAFGAVSVAPPAWVPAAGGNGPAGQPGQGGGGGSTYSLGPGAVVPGGAGGAGGCGGAGGGGGGGGGASIALLSVNATVQMTACTLTAGPGGAGGSGGYAQSGQSGAAGWSMRGTGDSASGGTGGGGAGGSGGAGGAAGISAGIVYVGDAPATGTGAIDATQFVLPTALPSAAGIGGPGGNGGGLAGAGPTGPAGHGNGLTTAFDVLGPPWS